MIESIFLDLLLTLIVLMMAAIGAFRGGLREAFSAAGVVLGILLAGEWAGTWGEWLAGNTNLSDGGARFSIAVAILVFATALVGYGVGTSFNYHPGPGGRMFGLVLGAGSAVVAIAYVLTWIRTDLFDGDEPEVVRETYLARMLDGDAGAVLLVVSGMVLVASLFGSIVRERDDEEAHTAGTPFVTSSPSAPREAPDKVERAPEVTHPSVPVQVRQVRHWDDRTGDLPSRADRQWSNTWPSDAPGVPQEERPARTGEVQQARERRRGQREPDGKG
jgi:uncharacterized membrane protein required for colicin V production